MNAAYIVGVLYEMKAEKPLFKIRYYCFKRNLTGKKNEDFKLICPILKKVDGDGWKLVRPVSFVRIPWFSKDGSCLFKINCSKNIKRPKFGEKEIIKHTKRWFPVGTIDWTKVDDWKRSNPETASSSGMNRTKQLLKECQFEPWLLFRIAFRKNEEELIIRFILFKGLQDIGQRIEECVKQYKEEFYGLISFGVLWETLDDKNTLWEEKLPEGSVSRSGMNYGCLPKSDA